MKTKRILSILLAVAMVITLIPTTAFALSDSSYRIVTKDQNGNVISETGGTVSKTDWVGAFEFDASPSSGYYFAGWSGDRSSPNLSITVGRWGVDLIATFQKYSTLTTSVVGSGSISPASGTAYRYGDKVDLTASPSTGWEFAGWSGAASGTNAKTQVTMGGDKSVTATFTQIPSYALNINISGSGTVAKDPSADSYLRGTPVNLKANPSAGWEFAGWSGDATGSSDTARVTMNGEKSVTATFTQIPSYALNINISGSGTVSKDPSADSYLRGTPVNLKANPSAGWEFAGWSGDATGTNATAKVTMNAAKNVTATFTAIPVYNLTLQVPTGGGTITTDPAGTSFLRDTKVNLTATPNPGWRFDRWEGTDDNDDENSHVHMTQDRTVKAYFILRTTLTLNVQGNGALLREGALEGTYDAGRTFHLDDAWPTPGPGWDFRGWKDDATGSIISGDTITLNDNHSYTAVFFDGEDLRTGVDVHGATGMMNNRENQYGYLANDLDGRRERGEQINLTTEAQPTGKTGYTFWHWEEYNGHWEDSTEVITIGDQNLFRAIFKEAEYSITYNLNGGTVATPNPTSYKYFDESFKLNNPTRTGYIFKGWTGDGLSGFTMDVWITKHSSGAKSFTANWDPINYSVAYNANTGTGSMSNSSHVYDVDKALSKCLFSKAGCTFAGWATSADGAKIYDDEQVVKNLTATNNATVTLYAKWSTNAVTVTGYNQEYDADFHGVTVSGDVSGATVSYSVGDQSHFGPTVPTYKDVTPASGITVYVKVERPGAAPYIASAVVKITVAQLTVTADDKSVTYGDAAPGYTAKIAGFKNDADKSTVTGAAILSCSYTAGNGVGDYTITAAVGTLAAPNYTFTAANGKLKVSAKALKVTAENKTTVYGSAAPTFSVTYDGFVLSQDASVLGGTLGYDCTYAVGSNAGSYDITPKGLTSSNYAIEFKNGTLTVDTKALKVTAENKTTVYGSAAPAFSVTYDGFVLSQDETALGGALGYDCLYAVGSGAGSYDITPKGLTSGNYAITFEKGTLTVDPKGLKVTAENKTTVYGSAAPAFSVTYDGFVLSQDPSVLGGTLDYDCLYAAGSSVGTYDITPKGLTSGNYAITFEKGTLTVDPKALKVTAENKTTVYGSAAPAFSVTYDGFVLSQDETALGGTLDYDCLYAAGSSVGSYDITPKGLTSGNYAITFEKGTLTVDPKALKVTADNKSTVYGAAAPAFTVTYDGFVLGQDETALGGTLDYDCVYAGGSDAGSYDITPKGLTSNNYAVAFEKGTLTVDPKALKVTAEDKSVIYGAAAPVYTAKYDGFVMGQDKTALGGTLKLDCTYAAGTGAGTYAIKASGLTSSNYKLSFVDGTLTVGKAPLTIMAEDKAVTFLDAAPTYTAKYSGFVSGDDAADLGGKLAYTCAYASGSAVGTYPITLAGLTSNNYAITFKPGTLTVNTLMLTVSFTDYNGTPLGASTVPYGTPATAPANPTREGYTFTGWGASYNNVTSSMTLTAQYTINKYTVRFFAADGVTEIGTPQTINFDGAAAFPTAPARTGYAFDQWVLTGDNAGYADSLTHVKENINAVASYLRNGYTVTFVDYDGAVIGTDGVLYGQGADAPVAPTRVGYTFTGWDRNFDPVTGNITVTAQYTINRYTVTFVDYNGNVIATQTVDYNTGATAPADPTRDGYEFTGWDTTFDAVTSDVTVTAQYQQIVPVPSEPVPQTGTNIPDESVPTTGGSAFAWWWILVAVLGAGLIFFLIFFVWKRRRDEEEEQ